MELYILNTRYGNCVDFIKNKSVPLVMIKTTQSMLFGQAGYEGIDDVIRYTHLGVNTQINGGNAIHINYLCSLHTFEQFFKYVKTYKCNYGT